MLMLIFSVGEERYACDCDYILEVLPKVQLKGVPHAPDYVAGLLNFGGYPVPVVDLCQLIEGRECSDCMHTRVIMLSFELKEGEPQKLGLIAEKVTETRDLDSEQFRDSGLAIEQINYIDGVLHDKQGMVRLLEVGKLFGAMKEELLKEDVEG